MSNLTQTPQGSLEQSLQPRSKANLLALLPAVLITFAISSLMVILIASPQGKLEKQASHQTLDFVRVKRQETVKQREKKPDKPTPPAVSPPPPMEMAVQAPQVKAQKIPVTRTANLPTVAMNDIGFNIGAVAEAEYLPIVKIAPTYPRRALTRGLEGHCTVEYTVATDGTTRNVTVVEDDCSHFLFKKPSVAAAKKFRYQPRVIEGQAIEVPGIRNRFYYQIDQ